MSDNIKKILIIGAGIGQIHLVQLAKEMGLYVIVVSPKGYPAIDYADELFECDIYDYNRIVEFGKLSQVAAVVSDQNDLMVPTVAYVAEKLGLPGLSYEQALSYCDKNRFRSVCRMVGVPVPKSISINSISLDNPLQAPLPWIVKPADSQSSMGITKVECEKDYPKAIDYALGKSKHHKAIVEQFFTGEEFVCEGFVHNGKYYNIFLGDRRYFKGTLIPSQTLFPSLLDDATKGKIINCETKIAAQINPPFGIVHSEYLVNSDTHEFIIVESAIRGGGVYISSHLIPLATSIDANKLLLQCALGKDVEVQSLVQKKENKASAYVCFSLPEGVIVSVQGLEEVKTLSGVSFCDIRDLQVGQQIPKMIAKGQRKGPILICGKDRVELEQIIKKIQDTIKIEVKTKNGSILREIWN